MLALAAEGLTNEQIASRLSVSSNTVKTTFQNAIGRLEAASRTHAVAIAIRAGWID